MSEASTSTVSGNANANSPQEANYNLIGAIALAFGIAWPLFVVIQTFSHDTPRFEYLLGAASAMAIGWAFFEAWLRLESQSVLGLSVEWTTGIKMLTLIILFALTLQWERSVNEKMGWVKHSVIVDTDERGVIIDPRYSRCEPVSTQ